MELDTDLTGASGTLLPTQGVGVRVPNSPPNKKNPNLFPIGEGFGFFVFFGYNNEGSCGRRKTPMPCHRP
jgi:hypothetical protein